MSRILVTGGAGYIGSHTLRALLRAGHSAVVLDNLRSGHEFLVRDAPLVRGDVCDVEQIDIRPGTEPGEPNAISPTARGLVAVAILAVPPLDLSLVDRESLVFGPAEAAVQRTIDQLPEIGVVVYRDVPEFLDPGDRRVWYVVGDPCDGIIEALRVARGARTPARRGCRRR